VTADSSRFRKIGREARRPRRGVKGRVARPRVAQAALRRPAPPSDADEDPPERAEDQERPERDERLAADPARRQQHRQHETRGEQARHEPGESPDQAEHQPDPGEQVDVAEAERAGAERDRGEVQPDRDDDRDRDRGHEGIPDERIAARDVEQEPERDDREGQLVGQQALVEVDREPDDETREPQPEQDLDDELGVGEPLGEQPERERPDGGARDRPPADGSAGRLVLEVVLGPANRESIGDDAEDRAADGEDDLEQGQPFAPARASSTSVACVTPVAPRAAYGVVFRK
jgi:hypothetical protein